METGLSDTQTLFRDTTRRLLSERSGPGRLREMMEDPAGFDREVWRRGGGLGWYAMLIPEEYGGGNVSGHGLLDAAMVAEELGRAVHTGPFLATNVVAFGLALHGSDQQKKRWLPGIASGDVIATWAHAEPAKEWTRAPELEARPVGGGWVLRGRKTCVQDAGTADVLLVSARSEHGPCQFAIEAQSPGIRIEPLECLDLGRRMSDVVFEDVSVDSGALVGPAGGAAVALERQMQVALVLQCAESNGATEVGLAMTIDYSKERVAFGRPIGSYQAIKHRLADHRMWLEGSFATTGYAARSAGEDCADAMAAVRVAKAHVGRWSSAILHDCVQIHGGIGMTWDYDLHLYFRRVISNEVLYGTPDEHSRALVGLVEGACR